jgi:uncharacterized lipoprotein YbaY
MNMKSASRTALAVLPLAAVLGAAPLHAAARIAESGIYICADGTSVQFERRGYGPVLLRGDEEIHLRQRWVFSGFRFTSRFHGHSIDVRGRGRSGDKRLTLREAGKRDIECEAAPMGTTPGIVTGKVVAAEPISIPAGARLIVQLRDIARADAPAPLLGERQINSVTVAPPIAFLLRYPPASAAPPARPSLSARILAADGRLVAISDTVTPLPTSGNGRNASVEIRLRAVPGRTSK